MGVVQYFVSRFMLRNEYALREYTIRIFRILCFNN